MSIFVIYEIVYFYQKMVSFLFAITENLVFVDVTFFSLWILVKLKKLDIMGFIQLIMYPFLIVTTT